MASRYTVESNGDIALVAATAKTVLSYISASNSPFNVIEICASFDGVTGTAVPVTVELCYSTEGAAGTATSHTLAQTGGVTRTAQGSAKRNFSAEPTTLTVLKRWKVRADGGLLVLQFPLGREVQQVVTADAIVMRCTAAANVNFQGYMEVEEG